MMGDMNSMLLIMLFGGIGMGYAVYGKKQQHGAALICGIGLCALPYVMPNTYLILLGGVVLMAVPFFVGD